MISFTVYGDPYPQGSMRKNRRGQIIPASPKMMAWRSQVSAIARAAAIESPKVKVVRSKKIGRKTVKLDRFVCFDEPVVVWVWFYFATPANEPGGDRGGFVGSQYDTDKLFRAIGDALEAADIVSNDKRIAGWPVTPARQYSGTAHPRAEIIVASVHHALAASVIPIISYAEMREKLGGEFNGDADRGTDGSQIRSKDGLPMRRNLGSTS